MFFVIITCSAHGVLILVLRRVSFLGEKTDIMHFKMPECIKGKAIRRIKPLQHLYERLLDNQKKFQKNIGIRKYATTVGKI
jgi:hypothetical protein